MKWNTSDWLLGLLAGVLFGLFLAFLATSFVESILGPSSEARSYIGIFGLVGYFIVVSVRNWRLLRPKNPPTSTQS
jgi:hypothetical protein